MEYGESTPKPDKTLYMSPNCINYVLDSREIADDNLRDLWRNKRGSYYILGGSWDIYKKPITQSPHYQGLIERFEYGMDWEQTSEFTWLKERNWSTKRIRSHFEAQERLFLSIQNDGYNHRYPIQIQIGRNGELIRQTGLHRATISRILGINKIPAKVKVRHSRWQSVRQDILNSSKEKINDECLTHPDMKDVMPLLY